MTTTITTSSSSASLKGCCCCLLLLLSFLFLLSLAIFLIILLAIKPKQPQFTLQQASLQYLNLTTSPSPSILIQLLFIAKNDNIAGIKYSDSTFTIMYRGVPVGRGTVPGFYQAAHSSKTVQTTVAVDGVNLMQADAGDFWRDVAVNDRVEFRVMGDVRAKIRIVGVTSPGVQVSLDCAIVICPSKQSLVSKQCGFDGLQV